MTYAPTGPSFQAAESGLLLATCDPLVASSGTNLGGGFIYLNKLWVPVTTTLTNLLASLTVAGAGLTAGENWGGIYDSSGNLWAQTAEQSTNWTTTGFKTMALAAQAGYSLTLPGGSGVFYWAALLSNGTTRPTFRSTTAGTGAVPLNAGRGYPYAAPVPGAQHRVGYESAGGRATLISLNGLTITDNADTTMIWLGCN